MSWLERILLVVSVASLIGVAVLAPRVPEGWRGRVPVCPPWAQPTVEGTCR